MAVYTPKLASAAVNTAIDMTTTVRYCRFICALPFVLSETLAARYSTRITARPLSATLLNEPPNIAEIGLRNVQS